MGGLKTWLPIPILPLAVCVILGINSLLSESQFNYSTQTVLRASLSALYTQQPYEVGTVIILILQMRKLSTERLSNLPQITQLLRRAEFEPRQLDNLSLCHCHHHHPLGNTPSRNVLRIG